jgi:5-dehydro-4-deoxyglucarate dehydratase
MMNPPELRSKLSGVIAFPVTPFNQDLSLNLKGLEQNLERLLQFPLCAIIAAGGTGEMYSLTPAEHLQVVQKTLDIVQGKVPILTAVGFNQQLAVEMAKEFAGLGVDGILAFPPYYPNADAAGMFEYYKSIGNATPLGMAIYSRDWVNYGAAMVEKLAEIPTLIAWKDGQGDMRKYQMIMNRLGDKLHWVGGAGDDLAPSYYQLGIRTYTSSLANISPKLSLQIHELASQNDTTNLKPLMEKYVIPHYAIRSEHKGYEVSIVKVQMELLGMAAGPVRPPLANVSKEDLAKLAETTDIWREIV